jgi:hypothetical protein
MQKDGIVETVRAGFDDNFSVQGNLIEAGLVQ